ncbi:phosphotransferase family enzyme [Ruminiclostridium sufflavum DSM 19573]|uniref:Phosphotransferase family enzyme n=1 Tax=Ruminiclostridium sufflavum DSM 19573 TaxID=1121337 RepID=A0A318XPZ3_9FIRM|nr:aminoglycoside phosphotransferase family protein [Ruminiclostridium sufflavum]PYG87825.1 phosphotransferase family enzyme [Ruminiclostridium sufflavum DSM 19573]
MSSITKTIIPSEKIVDIVKKAFGEDIIINKIKEIKEGFFNTAYCLTIQGDQKIVLKVSPSRHVKVMRYEKDIMENEIEVLRKLSTRVNVPIAKVLYYDHDRDIIENEYFFMEYIQGTPLDNIYDELNEKQRNFISSELGKYVRQITGIKSDFFGDISKKDKQFSKWSETFLFMIKELLDDAKDIRVKLPYEYNSIYRLIEKHSDALDMVKEASLVHKDLWKGNIFVNQQNPEITGILDFERAIYGDILMEPVCGFLLHDTAFMNSFFGRTYLEEDEKVRAIMYSIYLFLIMVIECSYRQYPWENSDKWAKKQLIDALEELMNYNG